MSVYADSEYNALTVYENPRARKPRNCEACKEQISVGSKYHRVKSLYDGEWSAVVRCDRCEAIYNHLASRMKEDPDEYPDDRLNCGHTYWERWGEDPPPEIAALAFAFPGELEK